MCRHCAGPPAESVGYPIWDDPREPHERNIPHWSGEGAIYSPEYLATKEGNAHGAEPQLWWHMTIL